MAPGSGSVGCSSMDDMVLFAAFWLMENLVQFAPVKTQAKKTVGCTAAHNVNSRSPEFVMPQSTQSYRTMHNRLPRYPSLRG